MKHIYSVRLIAPNCSTLASFAVTAASDAAAIKTAMAMARASSFPTSRVMIYNGTRLVSDKTHNP